MSLETVQEVTSQPATPVAKTEEKRGAGNTSISDFARKIAAAQQPPAAFTPKAEPTAPVTEEPKEAPNAEVNSAEPKTEAKADTAEEPEEKTSEVLSPGTSGLDPKLQAILDKKINKEVAKRYQLQTEFEAKIAELEARISETPEQVEKEVVVPVPANQPLAEITSLDALNQYKERLANDIVEAEMMLHMDIPPEGIQHPVWGTVTKSSLIAALTQAKKDERIAIPAREKFLTTRSQVSQTAAEKFPFLKDRSHPGYQMAKQAIRDNPILETYPNKDYLVGLLVEGQLAVQARESAGKAEVKTPVKPKPIPTKGQAEIASDASITRAPTGMMNSQALQAERTRATGGKKSLGHKDFAELLKANQRFRNSQ